MQSTTAILLGLLLVSSVLATSANQPQAENSPAQPDVVPVSSAQQQQQQQQQLQQAQQVQHQQQGQNSPVVQVVGGQPQPSIVVNEGPQPVVHVVEHHQQPQQTVHQQVVPAAQAAGSASYYSPAAGMIQVVGVQGEQAMGQKPGVVVRNFATNEQYGQPESASIPANYKPFGSWGLYIGGNPADGYYTNYYKALGSSVEKQQQAGSQQAGNALGPSQVSAFSPVLKQASSTPFAGADYYPFAYSPSEFNSGYPVMPVSSGVAQQHQQAPGAVMPQVYSSESSLSYADSYATKKLGPASQQQPKGAYNNQKVSYYSYQAAPGVAPVVANQQPQLVAYPVPVGSQIVGSQQGVDGAFAPYGVHAFTRYAVKPTVVGAAEPGYYYSYPGGAQYSSYKQLGVATPAAQTAAHQQSSYYQQYNGQQAAYSPVSGASYYGFPMAQLHYSAGNVQVPSASVVGEHSGPAQVVGGSHGHPASVVAPVEASASEKSEQSTAVTGSRT